MNFDKITIEQKDNVLMVRGNLMQDHEEEFEQALDDFQTVDGNKLILNLLEIRYLSSGFIRLIAMLALELRKNARELVIQTNERVKRIIALGGVDHICEIVVLA